MIEHAPIGIPGGGFITQGIILGLTAFTIIYYFRENIGQRWEI